MQQDNSYSYTLQAVQQELNAMVNNNPSDLVRSYVNDLTSNAQLNNHIHELTTLCNNMYLKTRAANPTVTVYQVVADLFRGQCNIGYLHMAQWLMLNGLCNNLPPKSLDSISQQATMFYNMAVSLGVYNNQQQQHSQYRQPQFSQGFKPQLSNDLSQHGFNNNSNNNNFNNNSNNQPTQRVSYRAGNVTTVNQTATTGTNVPPAATNAPEEPVAAPRGNAPTTEPPKSDIKRWLEYHYERLSKLGIKGPDYVSSRPYDIMLMDELNADGERGDLWVLSNIIDVNPTFVYGKPQYNVYSPDIKVRYLVFNFDDGCIREGFLKVDEHPDMAYAALEQGAKPIKKTRSISDLFVNKINADVPKLDVIDPNSIESIVDDADDSFVQVSDEVKLMLGKVKELNEGIMMETVSNVVLCDSIESGEMNLDIMGGSTGTSSYVVCKPFVINNPREMEMVERFNMCVTLNDVKLVFDSYDPEDVEISRIYREMDDRFTQIIGHITWNEYRVRPSSVARDLGDLLNVIRDDFGNDALSTFIKETHSVIDTATLMLTGSALLTYKEERGIGKCGEDTQLMVLGKTYIVNNVDVYSNQLIFKLQNNPTTFNLLTLDTTDPAQEVVKSISDIYANIMSKIEDRNTAVYLRTKDNQRIRLSYGLSDVNQLHMSML